MNTQTRTSFSCPCCGNNIGEAAPLEQVRDAISRPTMRIIFDMLAKRPGAYVMRDTMLEVVYGHRADGGPERAAHVLKVFVSQMRRLVEPFGWTISISRGGFGNLAQWRLIPSEVGA